jgi:hypothetical protein
MSVFELVLCDEDFCFSNVSFADGVYRVWNLANNSVGSQRGDAFARNLQFHHFLRCGYLQLVNFSVVCIQKNI